MTIVLRPLEVADSAQVLTWRNSETVAPYMYTSHRIEPDEHARWLEAVIACDAKRYWIVEWDDRPVGLAKWSGLTGNGAGASGPTTWPIRPPAVAASELVSSISSCGTSSKG